MAPYTMQALRAHAGYVACARARVLEGSKNNIYIYICMFEKYDVFSNVLNFLFQCFDVMLVESCLTCCSSEP